jgi:hypothetical protein
MRPELIKMLTGQLQATLDLYKSLCARSQYDDLSGLSHAEQHKFLAMSRAAIDRIAGPHSAYARQAQEIIDRQHTHDGRRVGMMAGVVESLHADLQAGHLEAVAELIHGELFADFLEMASHLLDEGYKDAAAVIAGGTLEAHLRQLCQKHKVPVEEQAASGLRPKKADLLNAELVSTAAYSKLDQKSVTAWLDLRNKAAHGKYSDYSREQVALLVSGVRDFISRVPA